MSHRRPDYDPKRHGFATTWPGGNFPTDEQREAAHRGVFDGHAAAPPAPFDSFPDDACREAYRWHYRMYLRRDAQLALFA